MINTNALRDALALLLKSTPAPLLEIPADAARVPARAVGQVFQARLVAELPNGRTLLEIEGVRIDVKLPVPARIGETLKLEVLALEPRLTFALVRSPDGAGSDQIAVSASARKLTAVLDELSKETAAPAARITAPVLAAAPADTAAFAERLETALARSGLFYEAHQAQWVAGELALGDLEQEPQASLKAAGDAVHPQALALVRQQLEVLDTRALVWHGEVWPDQPLDWRVEEEARDADASVDAPPAWKTSLHLNLPRLGEITATLAIKGDQVHLTFADLATDTKSAVRAGQVALRDAFGNAGLELLEVKVDRDEEA